MHSKEETPTDVIQGRPIKPAVWDEWAREGRGALDIGVEEMLFLVLQGLSGGVAVDAGCGTGAFSRCLRALGYSVTGIDHSPLSLQLAHAEGHGTHLTYLHADLDSGVPTGIPRHGINLVVARALLPFLAKPLDWLQQVRDFWLAPEG
ncbi:class I SAM-dependent methyltransferase, partial [Streptomyces sp. NPDC093707]|uniref:class I SAM-dependent methyltransferase n=1 Tax=Streptomyces sp. NPDC093707 TaxID=3154984 RepID=UPI00344DB40C